MFACPKQMPDLTFNFFCTKCKTQPCNWIKSDMYRHETNSFHLPVKGGNTAFQVNLDLIIKVRFLRQLTGKNNNCLLSCRMIMTTNLTRSGTQLKKFLEHFLEIIL